MSNNTKKIVVSSLALSVYFAFLLGSAVAPPAPPVAENFSFIPPAAGMTKSKMNIAILHPSTVGNFFTSGMPMANDAKLSVQRMSVAMQTDIEKIIISRGFTTAGVYQTIDEMTFSQKERASLILKPTINLDLAVSGAQGTMSGDVTLELLEPMSREKVWLKRLNFDPISGAIQYDAEFVETPAGSKIVHFISSNSVRALLNRFYAPTMEKIWNHLDPREIDSLKSDTDKLKGKTQYRGG